MGSLPLKALAIEYLTIKVYSDGSISRCAPDPPPLPPCPAFIDGVEIATKDLTLNPTLHTSARLFLPHTPSSASSKIPVLLYFHGGGFCCGSTTLPADHGFLCKLAAHSQTVIISVEYRLAPEHRLPAAYDDCFHALLWLQGQAKLLQSNSSHPTSADPTHQPDPWLATCADLSKVFLGGDSAGANIAHHVAMRAAGSNWSPLFLQGVILIHPFFTSEAVEPSELLDAVKLKFIDRLLKLFLTEGANRDHPFMNPMARDAPTLEDATLPRVLVAVGSEDLLFGWGMAYYEALVKAGKQAKLFISEDEGHVFHLRDPDSRNVRPFLNELGDFLNSLN